MTTPIQPLPKTAQDALEEEVLQSLKGLWEIVKREHDEATEARKNADALRAQVQDLTAQHDRQLARADDLADDLHAVRDDLTAARREATAFREERDELRLRLELTRRQPTPQSSVGPPDDAQPSAAPSARVARRVAPRPAESTTKAAASEAKSTLESVYIAWCQRGGGLVGRVEQFETALMAALSGAHVRRVYRDADSPARPVRLTARQGVSPVEYWAVTHEGTVSLLPHPLGAQQFRELAPCFEGIATPAKITSLRPATVRTVGETLVVEESGVVH